MKIEEFFAGMNNIGFEFRAKLFLAVQIVCQWQRQQYRESGESYLDHLFDAAYQLHLMGMPEYVILGALLHDIFEDTDIDPILILILFGPEVYWWVLALTKKPRKMFEDKSARLDEYHRRWISYARTIDWTVIFGKAADRLHNQVTLHGLMRDRGKQIRVSQETLDFYVPFLRGEAKEIVPKEYHVWLDCYADKMENYALAFLRGNLLSFNPA